MLSRDATTIRKYTYSTSFDVKKTSSILLKTSVRGLKPGPGARHALWTEVVKKILKIGRLLQPIDQIIEVQQRPEGRGEDEWISYLTSRLKKKIS
jgi:hypothetical protein